MTTYEWKRLTPNTHAQPFSICAYFHSTLERERDANPISFSEPSGILCDRIAPIPYAEVSKPGLDPGLGLNV